MSVYTIFISILLFFTSCNRQNATTDESSNLTFDVNKAVEEAMYIESLQENDELLLIDRFLPPSGYEVLRSDSNSFAYYLQYLPLKPQGTKVKYYDGTIKNNDFVYCSVVDQDIDAVDLQQCADAVMRLRGEYLYHKKRYDEIQFNFLSDGKPRYFSDYAKNDYSYTKFRKYMKYIFGYANTASLKAELSTRQIMEMQIGDVLVQRGNPYGHAVIVVNMAENKKGDKVFMLAQSYMPAQETQILINPKIEDSPWYELNENDIYTPEWTFYSGDLKHF